jgi:uncharacterized protein YndB with AHSA1/START domain
VYASYETVEERPTLCFERHLSHPVEAVWRAITDTSELQHWFPSKVELDDLQVGAEMRFEFEQMPLDASTTMAGRVTELDPPRLFGFYWGEDHLRFELEPAEGGKASILRFTVALDARDKAARDAAGWHQCLDALARHLDGGSVPRPMPTDSWREYYDEYARRGLPTGAEVPQM